MLCRCACGEQIPVSSPADCTQIDGNQTFEVCILIYMCVSWMSSLILLLTLLLLGMMPLLISLIFDSTDIFIYVYIVLYSCDSFSVKAMYKDIESNAFKGIDRYGKKDNNYLQSHTNCLYHEDEILYKNSWLLMKN